MEKVKKALDRIFIEGLSAMAHGLFATLIIGTIIQQIGTFMGGNIGEMIFIAGKLAASLTGAGIGVAVAYKFKEAPLVVVSAATAGMAGAFASSHARSATSSGVPKRPAGISSARAAFSSASRRSFITVSMTPQAIALTWILLGASSFASARVRPFRPDLVAE